MLQSSFGAGTEKYGYTAAFVELQRQKAWQKISALQNTAPEQADFFSIATDKKGLIQIFDGGAERMLGYAAAEVIDKATPADISDPMQIMRRARALSLDLASNTDAGFESLVFKATRSMEDIYELTYIRKDSSRLPAWVCATALRDAQDAIVGYLLVATDNTSRRDRVTTHEAHEAAIFYDKNCKQESDRSSERPVNKRQTAETRLLESEARARAILAAAVDAIIIIDAGGSIESLNPAAERLFGHSAQEMVGKNVKMLMPAPPGALHDSYLHTYSTAGLKITGIDREVIGRRKNGDTFPMELAVSEVQTGGQRLFTFFVRDITERNRVERAMHEKNIELERANRMKSEFLATMSHELRTPLNAIIGFSEALKDGLMGPMSDAQTEYIGDIFSSGQHLLALINDILDLSKVEAGMMTLELEATELYSLLANSLSIVKEKAAAHRISLELAASDDLGLPQLDSRRTKQIIYNLLSNAVKFSADGSRVVLSARRVPRSAVGQLDGAWPVHGFALADSPYSEFVEICVSDHGIGISTQNMTKLFRAFSQIDSSLARKFEGTGLDLAMVRQLTELHGGAVAVASAEGEGARFAVWLPLRTWPPERTGNGPDSGY